MWTRKSIYKVSVIMMAALFVLAGITAAQNTGGNAGDDQSQDYVDC